MTTGRDAQGRPRDHGGQGALPHLPHDRQEGGRCASPTSPASAPRRKTRTPGLSDVDYLARVALRPDAFIVPGFNPGMPVINKPPIGLTDQEILAVIAYLQSLGGTPTRDDGRRQAARHAAARGAAGSAPCSRDAASPVVLVGRPAARSRAGRAARRRRAGTLRLDRLRLGRALRLRPLRLHHADPGLGGRHLHGDRDPRARRLRDLEPRAPAGVLGAARAPRRRAALRRCCSRPSCCCPGARRARASTGRCNVAARGAGLRAAPSTPRRPTEITVHDKTIDLDHAATTRYRALETERPRRSSGSTSRTAGASTTRTASSATATRWPATACTRTA